MEVFALLTGIDLTSSVGESAGGLGIRVGYNLTDNVAIEADIAHFPENPSDNFGQTIALAGVRAGRRPGKYGYFLTLKPGVLHFGGAFFRQYHGSSHSNVALDAGFAVEYRPSPALILRLDIACMIVPFGDTTLGVPLPPYTIQPGTTYNRHPTLAVGLRL
jgi:hypothetical protein